MHNYAYSMRDDRHTRHSTLTHMKNEDDECRFFSIRTLRTQRFQLTTTQIRYSVTHMRARKCDLVLCEQHSLSTHKCFVMSQRRA